MSEEVSPPGEPRRLIPSYSAPFHLFERERLASVREHAAFTRPGDRAMVSVACEATDVCAAPIGVVSFMDEYEERTLGCVGTPSRNVERDFSICAHTILEPDVLVVEDLAADCRFRDMPPVSGEPFLRFYAGAPIFDATGLPLGSVCVLHTVPHDVSSKCLLALRHLAEVAAAVLEARVLYADARVRYLPREEAKRSQDRLDALLLTLVEPRPSCS